MTQNKRIFFNVVATYVRNIYSVIIGLFCGRWMLKVLGEVDYGLLGVVGGMVAFMTFFNAVLASSVTRFYSYSVGSKLIDEHDGVEECRRWFNVAFLLHTVVPILLILIGYPIGKYVIENFLTIPIDRIVPCIWIWRFVMISSFITMVSVPFQAMYYARQEIAELTMYGVVTTTVKAVMLYWMLRHPGFWLVKYSFLSMLLVIVPQLLIVGRALSVYPECKFNHRYIWDQKRIRELIQFAGMRFVSTASMLIGNSGSTILVNKILGPSKNASASIGSLVSAQSASLSGAISGAFGPAVTNAAGAKDHELMKKLAYRASTFGTICVLIFVLPLSLEIDEVMRLWLENPPAGAGRLCLCYLCVVVLERISDGQWMSVYASGRITGYQVCEAIAWLLMLPTGFLLMRCGYDVASIGVSMVIVKSFTAVAKVYYARKECGLSIRYWMCKIVFPLLGASLFSLIPALFVVNTLNSGFIRIIVTTGVICSSFLFLCWVTVVDKDSKNAILLQIKRGLSLKKTFTNRFLA